VRRWPHRVGALLANASLRVRVMVAAAILVTVTSAVMGLLGTTLLRGFLMNRMDTQLRNFGSGVSRFLDRPPPGARFGQQHRPKRAQLPTNFLLEVVQANGKVRVSPGSAHGTKPPKLTAGQLRDGSNPFTAPAAGDPGHSWRVVVRPLPGGRYAVIAMSLDDVQSTVTQLEIAEVVGGALAVALLLGISFPLIRASLSPLARIEDTAAAIAGGDLSRRIAHPAENTEVGRLASALNSMLGRIESAYRAREDGEARARDSEDRMRRFVADASHELRTPLTSVRGLAEFYLQQGETASRAEVTRLMSGIQSEAARMGRLVDDLLLLARFDEDRALEAYPVDLASVAAEAVRSARAVQPGRPLTLLAAPEPVIVMADAARLRQVIDNLISNAMQHTPPGTPVTVTVAGGAGRGQLIVSDTGPGMSAEQASRAFERFYRTDRARSRASGGTGLGLSIVAALVAAHGGTVTVDTAPGRGAAFAVQLPLMDAEAIESGPEADPDQGRPGPVPVAPARRAG
jgi:two-component system, OmpR family, sensor kinase